ncbi:MULTISPECIES: GNAT family N-acetyltransferase [unclassified Vibrio]|uniref:GNAT family N-acetyltransferase n=1 Tax=unclassified Vibrio TaxID=2614977 RepID=UPI000C86268F|nr:MULTISPECIES: GNAT family N-acetyltransferase [unclassified Vibrio]PMI18376.1 histone acetyltransferase [Vibrio sp. 10N.286.46.E10]PMI92433.1 histone acetyltransferase [Vibrio sp. 10N.286.45.E10]PTO97985.1 histone acetyltransferase [Vibrio sp. 10N.286.45.A3]PTQ22002.1 histone acetyltransferase [Vibrio sp. 10N.286.46.E10]TKE77092.1 GNAT family N-acetyltransferase [Vibrio sp. F12]
MSLTIREVAVEDAQGIIDVLNPIINEARYTILDQTFTVDEEKGFIESFPKRGVFTVAVNETTNQLLGFQNVEPFATYTKAFDHVGIIGTYVHANSRGQGVAKQLFDYTFKAAKAKGYEKLFAYVRADNERALAVYLKQGFEIVGTAKKHSKIGDQYFDEILIEKFL